MDRQETLERAIRVLSQNRHFVFGDKDQITVPEIIELLKAQVPRVLTLAEVLESEVLYAEDIDKKDVIPVLFNARWGDQIVLIKPHLYGGRSHKFSALICDYGKRWRCWSKKPTDKQRLEVEWE